MYRNSHFVSSTNLYKMDFDPASFDPDVYAALRDGLDDRLFELRAAAYPEGMSLLPCKITDGFEVPRSVISVNLNMDMVGTMLKRGHLKTKLCAIRSCLQQLDKEHRYQLSKSASFKFRAAWANVEAKTIQDLLSHALRIRKRFPSNSKTI